MCLLRLHEIIQKRCCWLSNPSRHTNRRYSVIHTVDRLLLKHLIENAKYWNGHKFFLPVIFGSAKNPLMSQTTWSIRIWIESNAKVVAKRREKTLNFDRLNVDFVYGASRILSTQVYPPFRLKSETMKNCNRCQLYGIDIIPRNSIKIKQSVSDNIHYHCL